MKIVCVASARPNFMKIAPIVDAFRKRPNVQIYLTHTGQHYDDAMSGVFFRELEIPDPDVNLGIASGSAVERLAEIMKAFEQVCLREKPDLTLVVGDVDGTLACALTASKLRIPVAHVEAGLRSFDRSMPEELNRILVDSLADLLFCSEPSAVDNLARENVSSEKTFLVGNVMIDSLLKCLPKARETDVLRRFGLKSKEYAAATLHRPATVDDPIALKEILDAFYEIQKELPIVFPVHPRTKKNLDRFNLTEFARSMNNLRLIEPLGYFEFLALNADAAVVFTDSGGVQEETTVLRVPCVTLRDNTERPITCELGTNQLAGRTKAGALQAYARVKKGDFRDRAVPELWDGKAAERIADIIVDRFDK